jgi:hypothetical protein
VIGNFSCKAIHFESPVRVVVLELPQSEFEAKVAETTGVAKSVFFNERAALRKWAEDHRITIVDSWPAAFANINGRACRVKGKGLPGDFEACERTVSQSYGKFVSEVVHPPPSE